MLPPRCDATDVLLSCSCTVANGPREAQKQIIAAKANIVRRECASLRPQRALLTGRPYTWQICAYAEHVWCLWKEVWFLNFKFISFFSTNRISIFWIFFEKYVQIIQMCWTLMCIDAYITFLCELFLTQRFLPLLLLQALFLVLDRATHAFSPRARSC